MRNLLDNKLPEHSTFNDELINKPENLRKPMIILGKNVKWFTLHLLNEAQSRLTLLPFLLWMIQEIKFKTKRKSKMSGDFRCWNINRC